MRARAARAHECARGASLVVSVVKASGLRHPLSVVCADEWTLPYSRETAAYPVPSLVERKFWPSVGKLDDVYGDRNVRNPSRSTAAPRLDANPTLLRRGR